MGLSRTLVTQSHTVPRGLGRVIARWIAQWGMAAWWDRLAEAERGRFALWLPMFMGAGVLAYYALTVEPPVWIGAVCAVLGFGVAVAVPARPIPRAVAMLFGFAAIGFASAQFATARAPPIESDLPSRAVTVSGTVRAVETLSYARRITLSGVTLTPDEHAASRSLPDPSLANGGRHLARTVRIRLKTGDAGEVTTGDAVRVRALVRSPPGPAYPGGWDTQRDAFFAGLGASGYALGLVEPTAHASPETFRAWVQRLRETIAHRIVAAVPGAAGEVCVTLLTGASRGIPEADHDAFRQSGLAHLLAVAGLHIGIVMGFALVVARLMLAASEHASLFWPAKQIAVVFALVAGGLYMLLTGAHVPIVRSFAMACLFTLAILAGRQPVSVRGLGLAGIALMLMAPNEVPGVSFQMSFSAVLALISGYETLRPWLRRLYGESPPRRLLSYATALALTSTLAGTASLPYGAYHFGHVQIYYILSNMVAVPLAAFWVMPAGMIALLLMPFGLESLALVPMGWGAALIVEVARFTAALPSATIAVPHMPVWGLGLLSVGIAWVGIWRSRIRLFGIAAIAVGVVSPVFDRPPDIMVSGDARLIGFRTEQGVFLRQAGGAAGFTRDAWFGRWNVGGVTPPAPETFGCAADTCLFRPRDGVTAALLVNRMAGKPDCNGVGVVVSAEPARGVCPWPPPPLVDRFTVWKDGPAAIWLGPRGALVVTDRDMRGQRPWVPPPPKPRARPAPDLPMAPTDRGEGE